MRNTIINHIGQLKRIRQPISKVVQQLAPGFSPQKQSKLYTAQDGSVQYHGAPPTMIRLHDTVSQFTPSQQSEIMAEVLEQPRFKRNRPKKVPFPEFEPCSMFKVDWQDIKSSSNTDRDSNDYFSMMSFHNRNVREILFEDKLVLLYRADINIRTNDDPDIDDYVHVQYVVHHVDEENCYLRYNELLYTPDEQPYIIGFFKPCIIVPITNAYILFQNNTVSTGSHPAPVKLLQSSEYRDSYVRNEEQRHTRRKRGRSDDSGSDDPDAQQFTKKYHLTVGAKTVTVIGKIQQHDNLVQARAVYSLMGDDHMEQLLFPMGVYGHTIKPEHIISGMVTQRTDDTSFQSGNINLPTNHNKIDVIKQAWYQHPTLHANIALFKFDMGHSMGKDSIHGVHLMQHDEACKINYTMSTWHHWVLHWKGWKQLVHELLGSDYGAVVHKIVSEIQEFHIGERFSLPYLNSLSNIMRSQMYFFASRDTAFKVDGHPNEFLPLQMTPITWREVMVLLWNNLKQRLTTIHQLEYTETQKAYNVVLPYPTGHRSANPVAPIKQAQPVNNKVIPAKGKKEIAKKDAKGKARRKEIKILPKGEPSVSLCLGDLLNTYGASQQIACKAPCRYIHYSKIPTGTTKASVIKFVDSIHSRFGITDETVAFVNRKIDADKKFV
jgi:hypothetical protein